MPIRNATRSYDFAMGFVSASDEYRSQHIERWREVLANFMVEPQSLESGRSSSPYHEGRVYRAKRNKIILKDPSTHQAVMTYASKLVRTILGERDRGYIKARPRGWEDSVAAQTVSRLLRYDFSLPGHFRTMVESVIDMLIFGTSIVEVSWHYEEREMPVREVTSQFGVELDEFTRARIPVYDDVKMVPIDIVDFYPDPSRYRIQDMSGAAKRFRMNAIEATAMGAGGIYDAKAVKKAIADLGKQKSIEIPESFRSGVDQPTGRIAHSDFRDMIGYEYWGDVPWEDDQGSSRRVITVLNNVVVRDEPWPLADSALPWHSMIINPVQGRFYGVSPAEVVRYDQDFTDALKILIAEAVIRQVHPPIAFDPDAEVDVAALREWKADSLIAARGGPSAAGVMRYDANVPNAFALLSGMKEYIEQASGALGGIQGLPGPSREAATVGMQRLQNAMDRPELAAMVIENECLPPIGEAMLRRNQQFLDTEGLRLRVGEMPEPMWIGTIMGDFDVEFVGSRMGMSRQEKLQSYDRLAALAGAIPPLMMQIPWDQIGRELIGDILELPEVASKMQDPSMILVNMLLAQAGGQGGVGRNGVSQRAEPAGMLPAQATGNVQ